MFGRGKRGEAPIDPVRDPDRHAPALPGGTTLLRFDSSLLVDQAHRAEGLAAERQLGSSLADALDVADAVQLHIGARRALGGQQLSLRCTSANGKRELAIRLAPDPQRPGSALALAVDVGAAANRPESAGEGRRAGDFDLVAAAARELARSVDADEARTTICEAVLSVSGASRAILLEPDSVGERLSPTAAAGTEISAAVTLPARDDSAPARALSGNVAQFVRDREAEPTAVRELMQRAGVRSALFQPIARGRSVRAVSMLGWVGRADPPDDRTSGLAEAVAAEAAVALDRGAAFARLAAMAATDSLTGLPNRRAWEDGLGREMARAARERSSLTVAMVDLDNFKWLNDHAGHAVGDRMLKSIAACWRPMVRGADLLARYGGDEFGLALPECGPDAAAELIERLRQTSGSTSEFSCGLVLWDGREGRDALVARADQALYRAKAQGPGSLFFGG